MKHLKTINELFQSPELTVKDIEEMVAYLEEYTKKNGYNLMKLHPMNMSFILPDLTQKRIGPDDPYGEEEWEIPKPKLMSYGLKIFDGNNSVLGFSYKIKDGKKCWNELFIDDSSFTNIDIDLLKKLIEK
jgi:hypothetical protein